MRIVAVAIVVLSVVAHGSRVVRKEAVEPLGEASPVSQSGKLEALQPVLAKLRQLDPKTFGVLRGMLDQARGGADQKTSFLEYLQEPQNVQNKIDALQPVLAKLKGLDSKTFGLLKGMMAQVGKEGDS
mmetsp:Transcript_18569/g.43633  ORF Transcript_18569/g.43633 Transcript_18569/m.43633 type:complete len:128 (+) Transcript_18569:70-453(+)|eukprot:CAMPEP_0171101624 /NCGR_PEP_ID=MMETSP0766_2-20121228/55574_1 /TAXON_ID=439317 /ORGANISM="Gambierdiscus australes, Strain CAWD 149" /LENGTH=127 /DNA_ID=CAMNT_0011561727 /DNA_START=49 /DNA_END=432 /DNA_ORIENTATION=+